MNKQTILCVDDEIDNVDALERLFRQKYTVLKAGSAQAALDLLAVQTNPVSVIITDQKMPGMTGVQFLEQTLLTHPDTTRILLTGYTDIESIIEAINAAQIFRYLNKPWDPVDLLNTVERGVERFLMTREIKEKNEVISKSLAELQVLDQAKDQFMILINHELKTPLTSILSFAELLRETRLTEEQTICVKRIHRSAERLREIVEDVLLLVSSEMKSLKVKVAPFDCRSFQISMKPETEKIYKQKNISLKYLWLDKKIVGDQALLTQVVDRVVQNAVKFAKEGSAVGIKTELTSPHRAKFSIANDGPPVPDNIKEKIFRPFFLDENVMNHSTGMGLGLTICHSILKSHSSLLKINNTGTGVEVSFELPCL
jgi:signal transduction histidine kinase